MRIAILRVHTMFSMYCLNAFHWPDIRFKPYPIRRPGNKGGRPVGISGSIFCNLRNAANSFGGMLQAMGFLPRRELHPDHEREVALAELGALRPQDRAMLGALVQHYHQTGILDLYALEGSPHMQRLVLGVVQPPAWAARAPARDPDARSDLQRVRSIEDQRGSSPGRGRSPTPPGGAGSHRHGEEMERLLQLAAARQRGSSGNLHPEERGGEDQAGRPPWPPHQRPPLAGFPPGMPYGSIPPGALGRSRTPPASEAEAAARFEGGMPPHLHGLGGMPPGMAMPVAFNHALAGALGLGGHVGMPPNRGAPKGDQYHRHPQARRSSSPADGDP